MLAGNAHRVLLGCLLLQLGSAEAKAQDLSIRSIDFRQADDGWRIRLESDGEPIFSVFRVTEPFRLLVDVANARLSTDGAEVETRGVVTAVRTSPIEGALRVEVELAEPRQYSVQKSGDGLDIFIQDQAPDPAVQLAELRVERHGGAWNLTARSSGTLRADSVHLETLQDPSRIVVDLHNARIEPKYQRLKVNKAGVTRARVADKGGSVRIVLDVAAGKPAPGLEVEDGGHRLRLKLVPPASAPPAPVARSIQSPQPAQAPSQASARPRPAEPEEAGSGKAMATAAAAPPTEAPSPQPSRSRGSERRGPAAGILIEDVRFEPRDGFVRFTIQAEHPLESVTRRGEDNAPRLVLPGARLPKRLERTLDVNQASKGAVAALSSYNTAEGVVLSAGITDDTEHRHWTKDGRLMWDFRSTQTEVTAYPTEGTAAAYQANLATRMADLSTGQRRYRGRRISLDLQDADIKNVLRLLADVSKLNIVAGDDVSGRVTIKLRNVPWDQALDIILRSRQLDKTRNGNIIRVAPIEVLQREEQLRIERQRARVELEPLTVRLIPVSYAVADEIQEQVQALLSPRGKVNIDERTNVLIVEDIAEILVKVERLVQTLDTQTPQVLIESRIVEARNNFSRELGIQWGGEMNFSRSFGTQTGLDFPSDLIIRGGADDQQNNVAAGVSALPNYAVNLPAAVGSGGGGALGFVLGSVDSSILLNLRLSAAEAVGKVKLVSAPKIVTLDNIEARILSGERIPITVITANGPTTRFIEANLELGVTPHVTQDGAILMRVEARKNELSDRVDFLGVPGVITNEATTEMLVDDGDTAVLGGLYRRNSAENEARVPWLGKVPVLGWLFKTTSRTDSREELLIFISPRIVNRQSALVNQ